MAGKGGGAWKVAYADFVTAMMAFFLVMWITAQNKPVRKAIANYFNDPFSPKLLPNRDEDARPRSGGRHRGARGTGYKPGEAYPSDVENANPTEIYTDKPSLIVLRRGSVTSVGAAVVFPEGSAELDELQKARLRELLPVLLGKPQKLEIRGHASRRPLPEDSTFSDSWQLSYARCLAVREYLEQHGIESQRMRLSQAGAFEPVTLQPDSKQYELNSRVEIYLLAEFADDLMGTPEERGERLTGDAEKKQGAGTTPISAATNQHHPP